MRLADRLIFVGVNERADALGGRHLGEQACLHTAVDDVDAAAPPPCRRSHRMLQFGQQRQRHVRAMLFQNVVRLLDRQLPQ